MAQLPRRTVLIGAAVAPLAACGNPAGGPAQPPVAAGQTLTAAADVGEATVVDGDRTSALRLDSDLDETISYAQCSCSHFRYHKLRQGPCRHMVALLASEALA